MSETTVVPNRNRVTPYIYGMICCRKAIQFELRTGMKMSRGDVLKQFESLWKAETGNDIKLPRTKAKALPVIEELISTMTGLELT